MNMEHSPEGSIEFRPVVPTPERLEGEHVVLLPMTFDDATDIYQSQTDEVSRFYGRKPADIQTLRRIMDFQISHAKMGREYVFTIKSKEDEFLGQIGLHEGGLPRRAKPAISIWLKEEAQRQGFGYEAGKALIDWAQSNLDLDYIVYDPDERNIPSQKLAESLGGEFVGFEEKVEDGETKRSKVYHIKGSKSELQDDVEDNAEQESGIENLSSLVFEWNLSRQLPSKIW